MSDAYKGASYWDAYLAEQERLMRVANAQVEGMMDDYGMSITQAHAIAQIDLSLVDPNLLQEITLKTGVDLRTLETKVPGPSASRFRQKTRALAV